MALDSHLALLGRGRAAWKAWRQAHRSGAQRVVPDLSGADLSGLDLSGYDLSEARMERAKLRLAVLDRANLVGAQLRSADLSGARLRNVVARFATLSRACLADAECIDADFRAASFRRADLSGADFTRAVLRHASLVEANVEGAVFRNAEVYGAAAWNLNGTPADQRGLVIQAATASRRPVDDPPRPPISVDDLLTAQLLFILLDNENVARVLQTSTKRTVLLLGRFTPQRKAALETLRKALLDANFVPLLFDFKRAAARDLTETIMAMAQMACFVVVDLTDAKSVAQELSHIVPFMPSLPVVPIIRQGEPVYAMFEHFTRYAWVLPRVQYRDERHLASIFRDAILRPGYEVAMRGRGRPDATLPPTPARR
jgi:hypothetical protein